MPSTPVTFRRTLARALAPKLLLLVLAFAYFAPGYLVPSFDLGTDADVMQIRPDVADAPSALLEEHDCWTGEAPAQMAGVMPGHVVVSVDNESRVGGSRMVGMALEQIFEGADHGLIVWGFCR